MRAWKALFGSNKGVDMFGQFIYDNASKDLRRKIVEKADEEGYEWTDPLRFSKSAQEVFSDIASEASPQCRRVFFVAQGQTLCDPCFEVVGHPHQGDCERSRPEILCAEDRQGG